MAEERVPAGWYPDPSGLPQLRWWDNHRWTEFVSDSQIEETAEEVAPEPVVEIAPEPVIITQVAQPAQPAIEQPIASAPTDLGSAFDAVFGRHADETVHDLSAGPRLADAFDAAFGTEPAHATTEPARPVAEPAHHAAEPAHHVAEPAHHVAEQTFVQPAADPLEALFASSATSPIGVGTGETIGEALMRALQSA